MSFREIEIKSSYDSDFDDILNEFYIPVLQESVEYYRIAGFFTSAALAVAAKGIQGLLKNNGKMKLIAGAMLKKTDCEAIRKGIEKPEEVLERVAINDLNLIETKFVKDHVQALSWMIANKSLEIRIALVMDENKQPIEANVIQEIGLFHQKVGILIDKDGKKISFSGSVNETARAWKENIEQMKIFRNWIDYEKNNFDHDEKIFLKFWSGIPNKVKIFNMPDALKNKIIKLAPKNIDDLNLRREEKGEENKEPKIPSQIELRGYQSIALANWVKEDCKGLFEMATGTGKTVTAINCALYIFNKLGYANLLILVPTLTLACQWEEELEKFNFQKIIQANSNNKNWYNDILKVILISKVNPVTFCIISTYDTFIISNFQSLLSKLNKNALIIADEVHNFGTQKLMKLYPQHISNRIGLSATPARYFDETGTDAVLEYFNAVEKITFKFGMKEAIDKGYLCEYKYFPYIVHLTRDEMEEYREISKNLMMFFDAKNEVFKDSEIVSSLLLKRKRIIHKANNKLGVLRKILSILVKENPDLKYTLLYVPEGKPQKFEKDDQRLVNEYAGVVSNEFNLKQHQYIGVTDNKQEVLKQFANGEIAVLTAMKCLDEGVDVKRTEIAIFGASTSNPRQFIQRRGRILRKHPEKKYARIYDMIVVPSINILEDKNVFEMDKSLLKKELIRVQEFASMAINKYSALKTLQSIAEEYNIDIYSF